nr:MAG TPA: PRP1 splicing factor, N-terminal [Caudoviricetes sp.]
MTDEEKAFIYACIDIRIDKEKKERKEAERKARKGR